jgi:hypothetical protein
MHANVRFEHRLLAVESEHTVNGMLELQAPPAPEERPDRRCTSLSSSIGRARWPGPNSKSPRSALRSWSGGSRRPTSSPWSPTTRTSTCSLPSLPSTRRRSFRGSARSAPAARRTCPAGG